MDGRNRLPGHATPTGRTFLLALLAPLHPTYSPLILPLGFHSNTLTPFGGGPGTVALHAWPNPVRAWPRGLATAGPGIRDGAARPLPDSGFGSLVVITLNLSAGSSVVAADGTDQQREH